MTIGLSHISFTYPGEKRPIFEDLTFQLKGPGFFSLFGLSGAGKSTLAQILAGLLQPSGGRRVLPKPRPEVLYTHNGERLPVWEDCWQHLKSVTPPNGQRLLDEFLKTALHGVDLGVRFRELSLGQKNRVNMARYIVQDFDCLIIDEALANVDEPTRESILKFLKESFPQRTFLYISHNIVEVARFSKAIYVLTSHRDHTPSMIKEVEGLDEAPDGGTKASLIRERGLKILEMASS